MAMRTVALLMTLHLTVEEVIWWGFWYKPVWKRSVPATGRSWVQNAIQGKLGRRMQ